MASNLFEEVDNLKRCPILDSHEILERMPARVSKLNAVGQGNTGTVYRVMISDDELFDGQPFEAALKEFQLNGDPQRIKDFWNEVITTGKSLVDIYAYHENGQRGYFFTELLRGKDLVSLHQLATFHEALALFAFLLIHSQLANRGNAATVHNDIKPDNVIKLDHTAKPKFRLIDWGLSCLRQMPSDSGIAHQVQLCENTELRGTEDYVSPWLWKYHLDRNPQSFDRDSEFYDPRWFLLPPNECFAWRERRGVLENRAVDGEEEELRQLEESRRTTAQQREGTIRSRVYLTNELWGICATVYAYITGHSVSWGQEKDLSAPWRASNYPSHRRIVNDIIEALAESSPNVPESFTRHLGQFIADGLRPSGLPCNFTSETLTFLLRWAEADPVIRSIVQDQLNEFRCHETPKI